jgi:hypothetical protein
VLAILDADLDCTATLPAAAEMTASLHIAGTGSSILDSVFVCRKPLATRRSRARQVEMPLDVSNECRVALAADAAAMRSGGVKITVGDLRCLIAGHVARIAIRTLRPAWNREAPLPERLRTARQCLEQITQMADVSSTVEVVAAGGSHARIASSSQREAQP